MIKIAIDREKENKFITNMIKYNKINILMPYTVENEYLYIDNDNKVSLKEKLSSRINSKNIVELFYQLVKSVEILEKYMIDELYIDYDLDNIFTNGKLIYFIVNPFEINNKKLKDIFFELLMNYWLEEDDFDMRIIKLKNIFTSEEYNINSLKSFFSNNNRDLKIFENDVKEKKSTKKVTFIKKIKENRKNKNTKLIVENDIDSFFKFPKK